MKLYLLSDLHGRTEVLEHVIPLIDKEDVLVLSGDLTHFGNAKNAEEQFASLLSKVKNVLAIHGNCDYESIEYWLRQKGYSLNERLVKKSGYFFFGVGASLPCPGSTPSEVTEEYFEKVFSKHDLDSSAPLVIITHQPPFNTKLDRIISGKPVGSRSIRKAVEKLQPHLLVCGHIHESRNTDKLGSTVMINPGAAASGHYAIFDLENNTHQLQKI